MGCLHAVLFLSLGSLVVGEITNKGWWKDTVFYQIYPRSFMDYNGDGVGDLKGITSKLEHFVDAGIGAVWISPIYTSPMVDFGYDIANFREIDPIFGNLADFQALTAKAKQLGIKVILDFVPNHTSDEHEWFKKSVQGIAPYDKYYVWRDGTVDDDGTRLPPNNWISVFSGPAWTFNEQRGQWYFHQFAEQQPDLNYFNTLVQSEMKNVLSFWLSLGVDGFRVDAVPHLVEVEDLTDEPLSNTPGVNPNDYPYLDHIYTKDHELTYQIIKEWKDLLDDYADSTNTDEKVLMTEAYTDLPNTMRYYDCGVQIPFNFKFIMEISNDSTAVDYKNAIETWLDNMPKTGVANWVMGNHDRSRTASRFPDRADQMTMLAMILPGVAVTYNGEEIGMTDTWISWANTQDPQACNTDPDRYEVHSRDPNRSPFQWDATKNAGFSTSATTWIPVNSNYLVLNLKQEKQDLISHYKVYQALTKLRKETVLREGEYEVKIVNNQVLAVIRTHVEGGVTEKVILLINFDNSVGKTVDLTASSIADKSAKTSVYTSNVQFRTTVGAEIDATKIQLPAKASIVLLSRSGAAHITGSIFLMIFALVIKHFLIQSD
ncbi:alpha-glucosidase-like [Neodiprion fabricii]|uniref:alpha-glucosidase-like n=1 Tax=Neodiprion fabricii TaxID=2872261 RepID=UPI001ED92A39|nr:alpha-glucosidase-like [Neodiprion fabricii]